MYLLRKFQVDMVGPRTASKQVPIRARLLDHLRMHRISPGVFILPVIVVCHGSCKKWLFARISVRADISGRGAGKFVEGEGER